MVLILDSVGRNDARGCIIFSDGLNRDDVSSGFETVSRTPESNVQLAYVPGGKLETPRYRKYFSDREMALRL
jgi:hypothetical protein